MYKVIDSITLCLPLYKTMLSLQSLYENLASFNNMWEIPYSFKHHVIVAGLTAIIQSCQRVRISNTVISTEW